MGAVKAVGCCWEEQTAFLCSSDIAVGFDSLGKCPWRKSSEDRVVAGNRWESPCLLLSAG